MAKKAYISVPNFVPRELPEGYTQVEYIQSSGTQYIDTGFKANNNTRVVLDVVLPTATSTNSTLFGGRTSAGSKNYALMFTANKSVRSDYNNTYSQTWSVDETVRRIYDKNKETTVISGTSQSYTNATFQCDYNLVLLAMNNAGTVQWYTSAKLYSCKIYDNDVLVRDYVPCTNSSSVAGLYDLANNVFYKNAGTGTFTAGPTYLGIARKIKKGYVSVDGKARKIKKGYISIGGVAMPFFGGGVEDIAITYSGNYTDQIVTMSNVSYRLLTLTSSGTLTLSEAVSAEVWMCGGGTSGHHSGYSTPGGGGAGAFTTSDSIVLSGSTVAVIGAGGVSGTATSTSAMFGAGSETSFGGLATSTNFTRPYNNRASGVSGGTGGGRCMNSTVSQIGRGDGVYKYPFGETSYFKPHCAGGGAGGFNDGGVGYNGGAGGTNGGDGRDATYVSSSSQTGGSGGNYGGGTGGSVGSSGAPGTGGNATFYGSGGGGAGGRDGYTTVKTGGTGYQGVIYIRIPIV